MITLVELQTQQSAVGPGGGERNFVIEVSQAWSVCPASLPSSHFLSRGFLRLVELVMELKTSELDNLPWIRTQFCQTKPAETDGSRVELQIYLLGEILSTSIPCNLLPVRLSKTERYLLWRRQQRIKSGNLAYFTYQRNWTKFQFIAISIQTIASWSTSQLLYFSSS